MLKLYYIPAACSLASHVALLEARADFEVEEIDHARGDPKDPKFLQIARRSEMFARERRKFSAERRASRRPRSKKSIDSKSTDSRLSLPIR